MKLKFAEARSQFKEVRGLIIAIIVLMVVMSFAAKGFATWYNLHNVLKDFSILLVVASGVTLAILLGKNDLSVGSVMSLSGIIIALLLSSGVPFAFAVMAGIGAGVLIGLLNGLLVGVFKLNHFISTFATSNIAKGIALIACNGDIISSTSKEWRFVGTGKLLGIFLIVWIALVTFLVLYWVLKKTSYGYRVYSVGGSETVARLSGINSTKTYIQSFVISGILAALGGFFMAGKAISGNATMGDGFEFNAIATVLIGGTPFDGGKGGLLGTFFGAFFISILKNSIALIGLKPAWQYAIIGFAILLVIIMDVALHEKKKQEERRRVES